MAIVYTTGTINQPDAGSVGTAMADKIRDDVVAHAAWDLAEEYFPAGGAVRWYVFKCLAASSGLPADFFVVMGRTLATGELRFAICEGYNAAGHTMSGFAASPSPVTYDVEGRNPNTFVLGTTAFPAQSTNNVPMYLSWVPSGTSTKWWLTVSEDGFTAAFNGPSNGFVHVGVYVPLTVAAITIPILVIGSGNSQGAITRNPAVAGQVLTGNYNNALIIDGGGGGSPGNGPALGFQGAFQYNDKLQGNQRPIAEQGINMATGAAADYSQVYGWALGKQKRMRVSSKTPPAGFAFGDAYALGGTLWVPYLPTDGRIWDTGVLS